jgi:hypothetical protein
VNTLSVAFCVAATYMILFSFSVTAVIAEDTLRPEILGWGIVGDAKGGASFRAWANVSDDSSGVRNVTLVVLSSFLLESRFPLAYNGSLYTEIIPPLAANQTHRLTLIAFDMANNSATSYPITVDRRVTTFITVDPGTTWPVVVPSSLALMVVVSLIACRYDRRRKQKQ